MKKYPEYKDSGIEWLDKIPSDWEIAKLGYHARMIVPMRDKPKELDGEIPWLRIEDFDGKYVSESKSNQGVSQETIVKMNLKVFPVGTVLCSCSCNMGKTAIVSSPLITNQTFIGIVPQDIVSDYLYYYMSASEKYLNSLGTGTIQSYLSREDFEKLKIPYPNKSEQTAIANFLDYKTQQIDDLITKKQRLIEMLKEERTAVINQAVTKGLDPNVPMKDSGIEWLGEIPEHWEVKKIKHGSYEFLEEGHAYLVTGTDFIDGTVNWETCYHIDKERYEEDPYIQLMEGDLLITKDGSIGKTALVDNLFVYACLNSGIFLVRPINNMYLTKFLYWILNSEIFTSFINFMKTGSTISHLYQNVFVEFRFPVPGLNEQSTIIEYLDNKTDKINNQISLIQNEIALIEEYKTSLINEAVTGKIDVRDYQINHVTI